MISRDDIKKIFGSALQKEINSLTDESANFNNKLYHYTSVKNLENILRKRKLRLSHYKKLNDPFEAIHGMELVLDEIKIHAEKSKYKIFWENFVKIFNNKIKVNIEFYTISFSHTHNNHYLWDEYGGDGKGICIAFSPEFSKSIIVSDLKYPRKLIVLERIHYNKGELKIYIEKLVNIVEQNIDNKIPNFNEDIFNMVSSELAIFIIPLLPKLKQKLGSQGQEWYKEDESRFYQICFKKKINDNLSKESRLPLPKNPDYSTIDINQKKHICEIWLGQNCIKNRRQVEALLQKYGFNNTQVKSLY